MNNQEKKEVLGRPLLDEDLQLLKQVWTKWDAAEITLSVYKCSAYVEIVDNSRGEVIERSFSGGTLNEALKFALAARTAGPR